jgi:hypothetical protein
MLMQDSSSNERWSCFHRPLRACHPSNRPIGPQHPVLASQLIPDGDPSQKVSLLVEYWLVGAAFAGKLHHVAYMMVMGCPEPGLPIVLSGSAHDSDDEDYFMLA